MGGIIQKALAGIMHKIEDTLGRKKKDEQAQGHQHKTGGLPAGEYRSQGGFQINHNQGGRGGHGLKGGQGGHGILGDQCQGRGGRGGLQGDQRQGEGKEGIAGKIKDKIHGGQGQDGNKKKDGRDSSESD